MYYKDVNEGIVSGLPLAIKIFIRLRDDILRRNLVRGEKLTEQRICNTYNVSRTPVREAFRLLEQEGLIAMIPNRGAFVIGFVEQDIADMYDMRKAYEELAFEWAVERITSEELEELRNYYDMMDFFTNKKDYEKVAQLNVHFHELIYKASHNSMLNQILTSFQYYTKQFKLYEEPKQDEAYLEELLREHYGILKALEEHDTKKGIAIVRKHLDKSKERAGYGKLGKSADL